MQWPFKAFICYLLKGFTITTCQMTMQWKHLFLLLFNSSGTFILFCSQVIGTCRMWIESSCWKSTFCLNYIHMAADARLVKCAGLLARVTTPHPPCDHRCWLLNSEQPGQFFSSLRMCCDFQKGFQTFIHLPRGQFSNSSQCFAVELWPREACGNFHFQFSFSFLSW